MSLLNDYVRYETRRQFLSKGASFIGSAALASLAPRLVMGNTTPAAKALALVPHFAPKAKRVIWLSMAGGPSHLETFDSKPKLAEMHGQPFPESITAIKRLHFPRLLPG